MTGYVADLSWKSGARAIEKLDRLRSTMAANVLNTKNLCCVTSDLGRFTIWHCGLGQPSARLSRNSIAQFCVWTNAQFEVTNDMMLTVSPLYRSLCKLQNYLHNSTFQFVLTLLFPNKNTIKLLYVWGIVKIFCFIWCIWLNSCFTPRLSRKLVRTF